MPILGIFALNEHSQSLTKLNRRIVVYRLNVFIHKFMSELTQHIHRCDRWFHLKIDILISVKTQKRNSFQKWHNVASKSSKVARKAQAVLIIPWIIISEEVSSQIYETQSWFCVNWVVTHNSQSRSFLMLDYD